MKATVKHTGETKNTIKYTVQAGLANLGTLYFPKGTILPEEFEIEIPIEE